jgi:hypothetical protein
MFNETAGNLKPGFSKRIKESSHKPTDTVGEVGSGGEGGEA